MQLSSNPRQTVNVRKDKANNYDDAELRVWADRLNVTKVQLKAAINAVGSSVQAVEDYLNRKK